MANVNSKEIELCKGEIKDLLEKQGGLSEWEVSFIDSVNGQLKGQRTPTAKQIAKIHEIWDEHCR